MGKTNMCKVTWEKNTKHVYSTFPSPVTTMSVLQKRGPQPRAPSPTPTTFSQISNYRTDPAYARRENSTGSKSVPAVPPLDSRIVARTHFDELSRYLAA